MLKTLNRLLWIVVVTAISCRAQAVPSFGGQQAFELLKKQVDFGPRVPGSEGHQKCKAFLVSTLKRYADEVTTQPFMLSYGIPPRSVTCENIIARFQPGLKSRVLLCAHWDTRPWADSDPNPQNRTKPVLGANDGASGVAVLLEIARLIHSQKPTVGVDIVLFDGEDAGHSGEDRSYARGSQAYAKQYGFLYNYKWATLLDMVGDKNLTIFKEAYSVQYAPHVVNLVWNKARELGITEFRPMTGYAVFDDHVPLLEVGIPCIDIIDFDYPAWHTVNDTPDQCSPASLEKVGRVITHLLYETR